MKRKIILTLAFAFMLALALTICISAKSLTVGASDSDYATVKEAEAAAESGDIIIIEADITEDVNLTGNKSLEFVLKGNLLGGFRVSYATANEVTLTFRTEGSGDRTVNFKKSCDTSQAIFGGGYGNNLKTKYTVNFIGTKSSKLILNGESYAHGLNASLTNLTINAKNTYITGFESSNQSIINCNRLNLFDGSKIYGNTSTKEIFTATSIYVYGGEIYDNVSGGKYMFNIKNLYMYGGSIHDNYVPSTSAVAFMAFEYQNENKYYIYDGRIYDNYLDITASPKLIYSTKWNSVSVINKNCIGTNYYYSSTDSTVEKTPISAVYSNISLGEVEYTVVFKDYDGMLISAYARYKGPYSQSFSYVDAFGTAVSSISVPSNVQSWTSRAYYCETLEPNINAQGSYFAAVECSYIDDNDCTTALACSECGSVLTPAKEKHELVINIAYENGYVASGVKEEYCTECGYERASDTEAIIELLGYSMDKSGTRLTMGYKINAEAYEEYVAQGESLSYGVVAYVPNANETTCNPIIKGENGSVELADEEYTIHAELSGVSYVFDFIITGFSPEQSVTLAACAYVFDGESVGYICSQDGKTVQYNDVAHAVSIIDGKIKNA